MPCFNTCVILFSFTVMLLVRVYGELYANLTATLSQSALRTGIYTYIYTHTHKVVSREQKCRTHRQERSNAAISSADGLVTQRGAVGQTVRVILAQQLLTPTNTTARLFYTNDDEHVRVGPAPLYGDSMWLNVRYVTHRNKVNFRRKPARLL